MTRTGGDGGKAPRQSAPFKETGPTGHRARMRARVLASGAGSLADYEIIEMLLFSGVPRRDTKPMAKALLNRFGSLGALLSAPADALRAAGLSDRVALPLMLPASVAERLSRPDPLTRTPMRDWDAVLAYCDTVLTGAPPGQLRILFLDSSNHIIADEALDAALDTGELDLVQRHILLRALDLHATAFVGIRIAPVWPPPAALVERDAVLMQAISYHAQNLSLTVQDHLILHHGQWLSLRQQRRL
ncbi:JAB domain-containing protein [Gluconacetobacter diazotrophicus]|uniref:Putative DNA repair protein radC n=1 Tax=Gluconacetobacter diazotrophicus (strain ATCC 49037 / DSM 5601 / CCUG 37298 / CIP 103539 / LMG 7603 / PAl5) TaxID=272568 RepID=A9HJP0_GLUDA|nr:JAB domain-containing protein [Gluconacetobacter diazotrophicus]CAP55930.1 putative DNA repair protein radC [Gluconacetobacter diazotrophicus PA1 5]